MSIAGGNGDSRVEDGHHDGPGELFYCPMCMEKVPIILKSSFGSCGHAFCSNCVAKYVALHCFECPDCRDTTVPVAMLRPPEKPHIDLVTGDTENSQVDGKDLAGDKRFYCAKCMHVVSCACIRPSYTSCTHDFCSSCVALKLRADVLRPRRQAGKQPLHRPETPQIDIDHQFVNGDTENSRVNGKDLGEGKPFIFFSKRNEGKFFYCAKCMHVVACACVRPSFSSCTHDFCSSCVALKLRVNVPRPTSRRRRPAGKQPLRHPSDLVVDVLPVHRDVFDCAICMETVPGTLKFSVNSCGHTFCSSCIAQYIAAKLDDKVGHIGCPHPGCKAGTVELESCQGIIPLDILDRWGFLLCELAVGAQRMYCPFRECSALLLVDGETVAAAISEAECPHCHRLFCARCAVPWHDGFGCEEFQKLGQDERGREDLLLRRLVGREGWQRCPKCQMFVEKSEGCNYIKCRCGHSFCYRCASKLTAQNHFCNKCKR